jgi:uncharacterized protein YqeY
MTLEEKIRLDLAKAIKKKNTIEVGTLRLLLAEIHNRQLQKQRELTEEDIVSVIRQQVKLRREAIEAYQKAGRNNLVDKESKELAILSKYLPQEMPPQDLEKIIKETIDQIGAKGLKDFGKVMGAIMAKVKGKAEGATVASEVKRVLGEDR